MNWPGWGRACAAAAALALTGCAADRSSEVTELAIAEAASHHQEAVECLDGGAPMVDTVEGVVADCLSVRDERPEAASSSASVFGRGAYLLDDSREGNGVTLTVMDVGYATRSAGESEFHRAAIQCWEAHLDGDSLRLGSQTQVACPAGVEDRVVGRQVVELGDLVTSPPSSD